LNGAGEDMRSKIGAAVASAPAGRELAAIIETYLSDEHCADAAGGCPVAALASEISRQPRVVRAAMDRIVQDVASRVAGFMAGITEEERRRKAAVLFSGMSGTLAVARALSDEKLRRAILATARKTYVEAFAPKH
jgi:TetR/AcrR family transcriptional repressor of nem operon